MDTKPGVVVNYRSNSHKSKQELAKPKKVEKVIKGTARVKKKSEARKLMDIFIGEDVPNVKDYIVNDVFIPAIRKTLWDIVTGSADMFFGNGHRQSRSKDGVSFRDYNSMSSNRSIPRQTKSTYNYDDIELTSREEAIAILTGMDDILDSYTIVSIADYYDLAGVTGDPTANNYGWTDLKDAHIVRTRGGYMIRFPKPMPID